MTEEGRLGHTIHPPSTRDASLAIQRFLSRSLSRALFSRTAALCRCMGVVRCRGAARHGGVGLKQKRGDDKATCQSTGPFSLSLSPFRLFRAESQAAHSATGEQ